MGPLPQLYRFLLTGVILLVSLVGGVWLARLLELPLGGFGVGLGAGCVVAFLMTHDFSHRTTPHRVRRRP